MSTMRTASMRGRGGRFFAIRRLREPARKPARRDTGEAFKSERLGYPSDLTDDEWALVESNDSAGQARRQSHAALWRRLETWHGRNGMTLADERASQQGTQTST